MSGGGKFEIRWFTRGGPPKGKPNPAFPKGVDLDISEGAERACSTPLPYPTGHKSIGTWEVHCLTCGRRAMVTAASRPDDPRSLKIACLGGKGTLQ